MLSIFTISTSMIAARSMMKMLKLKLKDINDLGILHLMKVAIIKLWNIPNRLLNGATSLEWCKCFTPSWRVLTDSQHLWPFLLQASIAVLLGSYPLFLVFDNDDQLMESVDNIWRNWLAIETFMMDNASIYELIFETGHILTLS